MNRYNSYLFLLLLLSYGILIGQSTSDQYKSKYNIEIAPLLSLRKHVDSGYGWRYEFKIIPNIANNFISLEVKEEEIISELNQIKVRDFEKFETEVMNAILRSFDSALDKCLERIGNIDNADGKSVSQIKVAIQTYINKLKYKADGTSEKSINISFKFDELYLNHFLINTMQQYVFQNKDGKTLTYNLGTLDVANWKFNQDVHSETDGDGNIVIYNGFEDFTFDIYSGVITDQKGSCDFEFYCPASEEQGFLNEIGELGMKKSGSRLGSFEGILAHEVIHNALKQEASSNFLNDHTTGRWGDDATIEDIQLKIFPKKSSTGETPGFNSYESQFNFAVWEYRVFKNLNIPENQWTDGFNFYKNSKIQRAFNPIYWKNESELKYQQTNKIRLIKRIYLNLNKETSSPPLYLRIDLTSKENTYCDDGMDEKLKDYVIPYFCICGQGQAHKL